MTTRPAGFPAKLGSARDIADYVEEHSPQGVDAELIEELYFGCEARLVWLSMDRITPGPAENNIPSRKKEAAYRRLPAVTRPPILVDEGCIEDGHHRYRDALSKGETGMWCYVVEEMPEPELADAPVGAAKKFSGTGLSM